MISVIHYFLSFVSKPIASAPSSSAIWWPLIPSTGSGRASVCMTTLRCRRPSEGLALCAVFTSWIPGLPAPPTWGSTAGGEWSGGCLLYRYIYIDIDIYIVQLWFGVVLCRTCGVRFKVKPLSISILSLYSVGKEVLIWLMLIPV